MPENLENSAVATGLEKVSFFPLPFKNVKTILPSQVVQKNVAVYKMSDRCEV